MYRINGYRRPQDDGEMHKSPHKVEFSVRKSLVEVPSLANFRTSAFAGTTFRLEYAATVHDP